MRKPTSSCSLALRYNIKKENAMRGHDDEAQDRKQFGKMLKKAMPGKAVAKHLKGDIKEQKAGIKSDKKLMKTVKGKSCAY